MSDKENKVLSDTRKFCCKYADRFGDIDKMTNELDSLISIRCKEQREICAEHFDANLKINTDPYELIKNAPPPE